MRRPSWWRRVPAADSPTRRRLVLLSVAPALTAIGRATVMIERDADGTIWVATDAAAVDGVGLVGLSPMAERNLAARVLPR